MKSALSIGIIVCLVASPLAGCATIAGPRQFAPASRGGRSLASDWSRVGELKSATEVVVTIRGSQPGNRYFVLTDQFSVTVLNLTSPTLPTAATRVLRDVAAHHPEYFAAIQQRGGFEQDTVRVSRDGVFVANRKVADLGDVVETIARNDVLQIRGPVVARGSVPGAIVGGWLGFAVGAIPALGGASKGLAWSALIGSVVTGAFLGSHWSSHETEGLIYRAP